MSCDLSARVSPGDAKCLQYRKSGSESCRGCVDFVPMKAQEVVEVSRPKSEFKKGDKFTCPGCNKVRSYEAKGLCAACNRSQKGAVLLPTGPVFKPSVEYVDLESDAAEVSESFGKVTNADGEETTFGVDPLILMALRDAWCDLEARAAVKLSGLKPASAIVRAAKMVEMIQAVEV